MPNVGMGFSLSQGANRHIHWRRENHNISAGRTIIIRRPRRPRLGQRDVRIVEADAPARAAQRDSDRSSDEAQTGDERVPRGGHQRAIRMIVRSTTCEVVMSKYGRWMVTRGRVGFPAISTAR